MELREIMQQKVFAVAGDTLNPEKYAYQIKEGLLAHGYTVYGVGKELISFNDIPEEIDVIDLCINPVRGLALMKECNRAFQCIVIQPGAESEELVSYLDEKKFPYLYGCLLVGLNQYCRE